MHAHKGPKHSVGNRSVITIQRSTCSDPERAQSVMGAEEGHQNKMVELEKASWRGCTLEGDVRVGSRGV